MQKGERVSVKQMFVQTGGVQRHTVRWWWWWGSKLMLNKQESNHSNENEFQEVAGGSCPRRSTERATLMDANAFSTQQLKIPLLSCHTHAHCSKQRKAVYPRQQSDPVIHPCCMKTGRGIGRDKRICVSLSVCMFQLLRT